jgi:hypothetical protein
MKTIKIDDVEYIRKDSIDVTGDYVIVRCKNAGVHAGHLKEKNGDFVELENSRRLWRWWSKFTLSGLAMSGILKGKESECRFACELPKLTLITSDVCEIIPCTQEAMKSLKALPEHTNE